MFAEPSWYPLLFGALALLYLYWLLHKKRQDLLKNFAVQQVLERIVAARSGPAELSRVLLLAAAWCFAVLALMGPRGNPHYEGEDEPQVVAERVLELEEEEGVRLRRKAHAVVFLVDASASMLVADTRLGNSRLEQARELIDEVISRLDGQSVAIYAFTAEASTVVPMTNDYLFARLMARGLDVNAGDVAGTDLLRALDAVRRKHLETPDLMKTVILLSDGGDTQLEGLEGEARAREVQAILSRLGEGRIENLQFFSVGLGTPQGELIPGIEFEGQPVRSSLDEVLLKTLAERGGGSYYFANAYSTLSIAEDLEQRIQAADQYVTQERDIGWRGTLEQQVERERELSYDDYRQFPLGLALLCLACALIIPERRR